MQRAIFGMLFTIKNLFHTLSPCFEPLYTNKYLTGLLDSTVSHYTLRLEIHVATFVNSIVMVGSL